MAPRFLTTAGEIDETKVSIAIERKADELSRWRGVPIADCVPEARAQYRNAAKAERMQWLLDREDAMVAAARAFVAGALAAMAPPRAFYRIEGIPDGGSFERAQHCQSEVFRIQQDDRRATFAKCLASLDRSLAGIAASDDITRHLQAAE
ncbi:MAG: hypothetical protein C0458_05610 [Methylobacterium sp.]|nr:hypothetical protein [Methylobacterium sp.]